MILNRLILPVVLVVLTFASVAEARLTRTTRQAEPAKAAAPASPAPVAVVASCAPKCCPPSICYRHHKGCGCFDPCKRMEMVLQVKQPCTCCLVDVPVCIPACCTGNPTVCCYKGFLRRDVVEYSWPCGFCLKVVFDRCGDVTVHYYG